MEHVIAVIRCGQVHDDEDVIWNDSKGRAGEIELEGRHDAKGMRMPRQ